MKRARVSSLVRSVSGSRGAALLIVLAFLVIILVLTVSMLRRASTEQISASVAENTTSASKLADATVSLVQAQIQAAAAQENTTWISQPGMVRTYGTGGVINTAYKLYSASSMTQVPVDPKPETGVDLNTDLPPANWASLPNQWVDLNQPRTVGGQTFFPILDPGSGSELTTAIINGFEINSAPGSTTAQPAPMPVRWLYMLADGRLIAATGGSANDATFTAPNAPTAGNPIIGRIAFWTDDETCKVNVNTASFPTYFDTPRFQSTQDRNLADRQPARNEYQRFPGHPAMTSLASVALGATATPEQIFQITPRLQRGGSQEGTRQTNPVGGGGASAITLDSDRLYASGTEILLKPNRELSDFLSPSVLQKAKFFLTANSRSPETNPFGLPKIACWPIHVTDTTQYRTAYDRLIAFCATLRIKAPNGDVTSYPYFFQRQLANSPSNDWTNIPRNQALYAYLQNLTDQPIPGATGTGSFASKMEADRDQFLTQVLDYIRSTNLYDDILASSGGTPFTSGRTATNVLSGHGWVTPLRIGDTQGFGRFFTLTELAFLFVCTGDPSNAASNQPPVSSGTPSTPINKSLETDTPLTGSGTERQRRVQMALIPEFFSAMQGYTLIAPEMTIVVSGLGGLYLAGQPLFLPGDNPATLVVNTDFVEQAVRVGGYGGIRVGLQARGGDSDARERRIPARGTIPADADLTASNAYPLVSLPITVQGSATSDTMNFEVRGPITIQIYSGLAALPENLVQTVTITPPASSDIPIPRLAAGTGTGTSGGGDFNTAPEHWWGLNRDGTITGTQGRFSRNTVSPGVESIPRPGTLIRGGSSDVVRSMVIQNGDFRLTSALQTVPSNRFAPVEGGWNTGTFLAHNLREGMAGRDIVPGAMALFGTYKSGLLYGNDTGPDFPNNAVTTVNPSATGDFDTGISGLPDGPFINKPDEGSTQRGTLATNIPYYNDLERQEAPGPSFFSPSRIMPSPGMFGSLPTHVKRNVPWQTLLLRPQTGHPNNVAGQPADHAWLEFFWMPVVEPFAISESFSTDGKVNLNYQILPFTYLKRTTAMRAVLAEEYVGAIEDTRANTYKRGSSAAANPAFRTAIDPIQTLSQFDTLFNSGRAFRLTSELCDFHMVPTGQTAAGMPTFWTSRALTGDNVRERPYTTLYPRVTVRSNTFTVYYRVQALGKVPTSDATRWDAARDKVESEAMGQVTMERYIDPNGVPIAEDYAAATNPLSLPSLADFYRWRMIRSSVFAP